jgi:hypothetical protein
LVSLRTLLGDLKRSKGKKTLLDDLIDDLMHDMKALKEQIKQKQQQRLAEKAGDGECDCVIQPQPPAPRATANRKPLLSHEESRGGCTFRLTVRR